MNAFATTHPHRRRRGVALAFVFAIGAWLCAFAAQASAAPCFPNVIYKTDINDSNIFAINEKTYAQTLVGTLSFGSAAAATSLQNGHVYYVGLPDANNNVFLGNFDPVAKTNAAALQITGLDAADTATGVTFVRAGFNAAGNLYIQSNGTTTLYQLNPNTGVATKLGSLSGIAASFGDLAFDPTNPDLFYLVDGGTNLDSTLFRVSLSTLAATKIGNLGLGTSEQIFGLAFGNDGTLYAADNAGPLYRLDIATAAATQVANLAGTANDLASLPQTVNLNASLTKVHAGTTVPPGGQITYTITVGNTGSSNNCSVTALTVNDPLATGLSNPTYTASTGTYDSASGNWTGLNLGPNQTIALTVKATVTASAGSTVTNVATLTLPDGINNTGTGSATDSANVVGTAGLSIAKSGTAQAAPNGLIQYAVLVSNAGPQAADQTLFRDALPAGVTVTGTPTCAVTSGAAACGGVSNTGNVVSSSISALPANSSVTFTITATAAAAGSYPNTASITPPSGVTDPNPTTSSVTTNVAAANGVIKTVANVTTGTAATQGADTGRPGDVLEYTLTYTNTTGQTLNGFTFNDAIPARTTYVAGSAVCNVPATGCTIAPTATGATTTAVRWSLPALANGGTFTVAFRVRIN